jgi:hypothetical protein
MNYRTIRRFIYIVSQPADRPALLSSGTLCPSDNTLCSLYCFLLAPALPHFLVFLFRLVFLFSFAFQRILRCGPNNSRNHTTMIAPGHQNKLTIDAALA